MKKFNFTLMLTILFVSGTWGYTPTVEGLFSNPSNGTMVGKELRVQWDLRMQSEEKDFQMGLVTIFSSDFTQRLYNGPVKPSTLIEASTLPLSILESTSTNQYFPRLLWSVIKLIGQNDMKYLLKILRELGIDFKSNNELINKEKLSAMRAYRDLLKTNGKYDEKMKSSPEMLKLKSIANDPYFEDSGFVELVLRGGEFCWKLQSGHWELFFNFEDHRLTEIHDKKNAVLMTFSNYQMIGTENFFPELVKISWGPTTFSLKTIKAEVGKGKKSIDNLQKTRGAQFKHLPILFD